MLAIQRNTALRITILYLIFGLTWIFVSDLFDSNLTGEFNWFQLLKGSLYVISTAVLFYFTIRSISNKLDFSELILKELSDNYQYSIALINDKKKVIFFNKRLLSLLQKKKNQVVGKKLFDVLPHNPTSEFNQKIEQFYIDKKLISYNEKMHINEKESYVNFNLIPIFGKSKQFEAMLLLTYNLTEENILRLKNEKLIKICSNVFTSIKKNILIVDANYQIIEYNEINKSLFSEAFLNSNDLNIDQLEQLELKQFLKKHIFETFNFNKNQTDELKIDANTYQFDFCLIELDDKQFIQIIISDITTIKTIEHQNQLLENKVIQSKLNLKAIQEFVEKSKLTFVNFKNTSEDYEVSKKFKLRILEETEKILKNVNFNTDIQTQFQLEDIIKEKIKSYPLLNIQHDLEKYKITNNQNNISNVFDLLLNVISEIPVNTDELEKKVSISGKLISNQYYDVEINDNTIGIEKDEQNQFANSEALHIGACLIKLNMICHEIGTQLQIESTPNKGNSWVLKFKG